MNERRKTPLALKVITIIVLAAAAWTSGWAESAFRKVDSFLWAVSAWGTSDPTADSSNPNAYSFTHTSGGAPVTWATCEPLRVIINPANGPEEGVDEVLAAMDALTQASGIAFEYVGVTDADPFGWARANTGRTGSDPHIIVGWGTLPDDVGPDAVGRTSTLFSEDYSRILSAEVTFDAGSEPGRGNGLGTYRSRTALYAHELAHALGLGHPDSDAHQLMSAKQTLTNVDFGAGDLNGLAILGQATCAR